MLRSLATEFKVAAVPGNGDCFYHAAMIDLIHDVLTDKIADDSETAERLKTVLFPAINAELNKRDRAPIDTNAKSIKQAVLELLNQAPISALRRSVYKQIAPTENSSDSRSVSAIKQCDLDHLLIDICAPALRTVMLAGTEKNKAQHYADVKEVFFTEFAAFIKRTYSIALNLSQDAIAAATSHESGGEFNGMPHALRQSIVKMWKSHFNASYRSEPFAKPSIDQVNDRIRLMFATWWKHNSQYVVQNYQAYHATPQAMASRPQQIALAQELHCRLENVNRGDGRIAPFTPALADSHSLQFSNSPGHFDAVLSGAGSADTAEITNTLQKRLQVMHQKRNVLKDTFYPWTAAGLSQIEKLNQMDAEAAGNLAASTTTTKKHAKTHFTSDHALCKFSAEILHAKKIGYQTAVRNTLFGASMNLDRLDALAHASTQPGVDVKAKQEADDLLYAIQLQDQEIASYFKSTRKR